MRPNSAAFAAALQLAAGAFLLAAIAGPARAQGGPPTPQVTVAAPLAKRVADWDEFTGRFEAAERVDVRPRVSGYIDQVNFTDGAIVAKGDLLFTIDQRPFRFAVETAEADVMRTKAQVVQNAADLARSQQTVKTFATPVQELDQRKANFDISRAQELQAETALKNAQLNLEWSEVRAPIAGRVSNRRVDPGNLVAGGQSDATLLTTIVALEPIYFIFDASEADYVRYARMTPTGLRPSSQDTARPVQVRLADEIGWPHSGVMNFVDNEVNSHSGTIRGRATFANKDHFLVPGTFGRLRLFGGEKDALLIPDASIVSDQAKKIVYVLGPDNKIVPKPVTLGGIALGLRVVSAGLAPTDKIVIAGLANPFVRPGALVTPQDGEIKPAEGESVSN